MSGGGGGVRTMAEPPVMYAYVTFARIYERPWRSDSQDNIAGDFLDVAARDPVNELSNG